MKDKNKPFLVLYIKIYITEQYNRCKISKLLKIKDDIQVKRLTIIICILICATLIFGPIKVLYEYAIPKDVKPTQSRMHMNTGNTTRVEGDKTKDIAVEISEILYPGINGVGAADGYILINSDKWQDVLSMIPLANKYKAPIINVNKENINTVLEYISTKKPKGISLLQNAMVIYAGNQEDISSTIAKSDIKSYNIAYSDLNQLIDKVYSLPGFMEKQDYGFLVPDSNPIVSIPVGTWIANQGGLLLFYNNEKKPYESGLNIVKDTKLKKLYYLTEDTNAQSLESYFKDMKLKLAAVTVGKEESSAVNFARYYDPEEGIGWDAGDRRKDSSHNYIICSKEAPTVAALAAQLSLAGKSGPLLWTESNKLSAKTEGYLWSMKPNYWVSPAEGPYNHGWIIGNSDMIDYSIQARIDYIFEIVPYKTMGEQGVSGLDVISIIFTTAALCSALWIALHAALRMRYMTLLIKLMWVISALVIGPFALLIYILCYYNVPWTKMNGKKMWLRPLWKQTATATILVVAFGVSTISALSFWLTWLGLPNLSALNWSGFFLLGNPIILQMIIVYLAAFIINVFIIMPVIMNQMSGVSYRDGVNKSFLSVLISLTSFFIGRAISNWWLMMVYSPISPDESQIIWWGFMQLAAVIGFATAYVPVWKLVRYGKVTGTM
ncbi:MAG: putative rane protein [Clostridia bacterium]|jgi:hypothetical protein|nr:putative rane protein [Clostridia bacterium]